MTISRRTLLGGVAAGAALAASGCSSPDAASGKIRLEFFQFKSEAREYIEGLIRDFNAANPTIEVFQNQVADAATSIRARLVKEDIPDIITLNGDLVFGELSAAGVFYDFSNTAVLKTVQPAFAEILPTLGRSTPTAVNGLPFSNNACGIIFNKQLFSQQSVEPPTTWDALIEACEKFKSADIQPFIWGMKDAWTIAPMFNSVGANTLGRPIAEWYADRKAGKTTFAADYPPVFERMLKLATYGNADSKMSLDYNGASREYSNGKIAMYAQGNWAIPPIREYNEVDMGVFPVPGDEAGQAKIVSGVDVAITCAAQPTHEAEVLKFIEFMMSRTEMDKYNTAQAMVPTLEGLKAADPALQTAQPAFDEERVGTFSDHNIPQSMNLNNYLQALMATGDINGTCATLDREWDKVAARQNF